MAALKDGAETFPGKSVSAFTEYLINKGLREREEEERDPALKALLFMIGQLAEDISGWGYTAKQFLPAEKRNEHLCQWRTDPFKFKAFKVAVTTLLGWLDEPAGKMQSPITREQAEKEAALFAPGNQTVIKAIEKQAEDPEAFGNFRAAFLWRELRGLFLEPGSEKHLTRLKEILAKIPEFKKAWERQLYGLPQARRDLELPKAKSEKPKS